MQLTISGGREKPGDHTPINDHAEVFSRCGAINEFLGAVLKLLDAHILHVEHETRTTNRPQPSADSGWPSSRAEPTPYVLVARASIVLGSGRQGGHSWWAT